MLIRLFGQPEIFPDEQPIRGLRRKNRALLYHLAAHAYPLTRDAILTLFWPDSARPAAQQALRSTVYDLRQRLPPHTLAAEGDQLSIAEGIRVDVREFSRVANPSVLKLEDLLYLMELYQGDFLSGFYLNDPPEFNDWVDSERRTYRNLAVRGYTRLSHLQESERDYQAALSTLAQALVIEPLQEDLQRDSLRLHYLLGDRAGAIRQYETLTRQLSEELGVPPMPETRALYTAIITDRLPGSEPPERVAPHAIQISSESPPSVPLLPFTGRARELDRLVKLGSEGKLVLVQGAPGIGKTRLVEEYIQALARAGAGSPLVVLRGVAHELEQGLPYQPVVDALRQLSLQPGWASLLEKLDLAPVWEAEIGRLVPELQGEFKIPTGESSQTDEAHLWEAVRQMLLNLRRYRQILLFLDDLHWADSSTLGLLGYLARRPASPPVILIGTARPAEERSGLRVLTHALLHEKRMEILELTSLSQADTLVVASKVSRTHGGELGRWLLEHAEGHPYFLTELIRHAYESGFLHEDGQLEMGALLSTHILTPSIQNLILSRLIRLSETARRVLDIAAITGREFDARFIHATLAALEPGVSEGTVLDALDELRAGLIIQSRGGDAFSFDHSLTMEAALSEMGEARQILLHRLVAHTLVNTPEGQQEAAAGLIAHHFIRAEMPGQAAPYAFRAGEYASRLASWNEAATFYGQALGGEADPQQRVAILLGLGAARFHRGDFVPASEAFYQAIDLSRQVGSQIGLEAAYVALNQSLLPQSRFVEAIALGRDLARQGAPELSICAEFIWGTGLGVESRRPTEAEAHLRRALSLIEAQPGYRGAISRAHIYYQLAGVVGQQGKSDQAVALYREALELQSREGPSLDLLRQIMLLNNLAYHLSRLGDPAAGEYAQAGITLARERDSLTHLPYLLSTSGEIALAAHDLERAEALFEEGLALAQEVPVPERVAGLTANLGLVARERGLDDLARERLFSALEQADQLNSGHLGARIRCWLAPLLGAAEARARLREARALAEEGGFARLLDEIEGLETELAV